MTKGTVLILGARSDIGMAIAHKFASAGHLVQLAARKAETLESNKSDIELRHRAVVELYEFDAIALETHAGFLENLSVLPDIAVCVVGYMGNQSESEQDTRAASLVMRSNYEGPANILAELANRFEARGAGVLVGISSVAGERGRATNYVYGSAKAGFTAFLSGLRNRLAKQGIRVVTVLPGFVETAMTADLDLPAILTTTPDVVADHIYSAAFAKKDTIYAKPVWRLIMMIIRNIPEKLFKNMKL